MKCIHGILVSVLSRDLFKYNRQRKKAESAFATSQVMFKNIFKDNQAAGALKRGCI